MDDIDLLRTGIGLLTVTHGVTQNLIAGDEPGSTGLEMLLTEALHFGFEIDTLPGCEAEVQRVSAEAVDQLSHRTRVIMMGMLTGFAQVVADYEHNHPDADVLSSLQQASLRLSGTTPSGDDDQSASSQQT
jgi:hypothetical protein